LDANTVNEMMSAHRDLAAVRDAHYNPAIPEDWADVNARYREHFVGQIVAHGPNDLGGTPLADFEDSRYWVREVTDATGPLGDEEDPWAHVTKRPNLLPNYYDLASELLVARQPQPEPGEPPAPAYDPQEENPVRWVVAVNLAEYHPTDPTEDTHGLAPKAPTCGQQNEPCTSDAEGDTCCEGLTCIGGICVPGGGNCGAIDAACNDASPCCKGLLCVGGTCMGGYSGELVHVQGFTASDGLRRFFFDRAIGGPGGGGVFTAVLRAVDEAAGSLTIQLVKTVDDKVVGTGDELEAFPILGQPLDPFTLPGFARPASDDEDFSDPYQPYYPFLAFQEYGTWRVTFPLNMPKNMRSDVGQARALSEGGRD
jgi:hypothetical protein